MFRNQYDTDCITWSPAGRIHQIEYAMEAVKQGSAAVGLRSNKFALVATLKRSSSELSSYQKKIFKIDDNLGIAIAGLVADARVIAKYMRTECINHRYVYDAPMQVGRLVLQVADKSQLGTQRIGRRPYGVGLLVAGADSTGPHLFETQPSGQYFEYKAMAIGARSQAGRTYLERHFEEFAELSLDDLVKHALLALRETLGTGQELTASNVAVGYVGLEGGFTILEDASIQPYVDAVKGSAPAAAGAGEGEEAPMEDAAAGEGAAPAAAPMDTE
jgi:20S proteasome subunit alpha 6